MELFFLRIQDEKMISHNKKKIFVYLCEYFVLFVKNTFHAKTQRKYTQRTQRVKTLAPFALAAPLREKPHPASPLPQKIRSIVPN